MRCGYELGSPGLTREVQHGIELELFAVSVPPAGLALMTGEEIDLGAVGKGQLDLNDTIGAANGANQ